MIGRITGTVAETGLDWVVIDTPSGVGYKVYSVHLVANTKIGESLSLTTHLVVREDNLSLFGFQTTGELNFFQQLIAISGVGPKLALSILNAGPVSELKAAIGRGEVAVFTMISGIGKKTAERIIVDLKNQMHLDSLDLHEDSSQEEVLTALASLGYNTYEVRKVLAELPSDLSDTEAKIKYALGLLANNR